MKQNRLLQSVLTASLLLLPTLVQAHPGHAALDPSAGALHAGHESEWASTFLFLALTAGLLGFRWLASRRS